ncbi:MAG: DUF3662 domain-containing protein [Chloroflexi bacterium]|nr:DUF3662 domain-containing protein [Chloroflexota bacterium]
MGALRRLEALVESLLEGSLVRLLRGHLQPVEIAKRLERTMETSQTIGVGRTFVPNEYYVFLSPKDFQQFESIRTTVEKELADYLSGVAKQQHFALTTKPVVKLQSRAGLTARDLHIETRLADHPSAVQTSIGHDEAHEPGYTQPLRLDPIQRVARQIGKHPALVPTSGELAGVRFVVDRPILTLGRGLGNDVVLEDERVSRYHAEVRAIGSRICLADLKSTNGTWLNGRRITESILATGDRISLGGVEFLFEEA